MEGVFWKDEFPWGVWSNNWFFAVADAGIGVWRKLEFWANFLLDLELVLWVPASFEQWAEIRSLGTVSVLFVVAFGPLMCNKMWGKVGETSQTMILLPEVAHKSDPGVVGAKANETVAVIVEELEGKCAEAVDVGFMNNPLLVGGKAFGTLGAAIPDLDVWKGRWGWLIIKSELEFVATSVKLAVEIVSKGLDSSVECCGGLHRFDGRLPPFL